MPLSYNRAQRRGLHQAGFRLVKINPLRSELDQAKRLGFSMHLRQDDDERVVQVRLQLETDRARHAVVSASEDPDLNAIEASVVYQLDDDVIEVLQAVARKALERAQDALA